MRIQLDVLTQKNDLHYLYSKLKVNYIRGVVITLGFSDLHLLFYGSKQ